MHSTVLSEASRKAAQTALTPKSYFRVIKSSRYLEVELRLIQWFGVIAGGFLLGPIHLFPLESAVLRSSVSVTDGMSVRCDLGKVTSPDPLRGAPPVRTPLTDIEDQHSGSRPDSSGFLPPAGEGGITKSCLQSFLHCAPVRCIETVARFLDLPSFVVLLSLNSSLLQLCDSSALQPCWTHFALIQRILRHGENVLLPRLSPISLPLGRGKGGGCGGRPAGRGNGRNTLNEDDKDRMSPCQTFSRLLPRVTRLDLVRIGSLNSNWRNKNFLTEQRQVICSGEALDKAYVLPAPPFKSSFIEYSVAPDAQLNLQACPSVGLPACLQPPCARGSVDGTPLFTVTPSTRIFAIDATARASHGQSVEVKLPLLPAKLPVEPGPLIKFGSYAPKCWMVGEDDTPLHFGAAVAATTGVSGSVTRVSQSQRKRQQRQLRQQQLHRLHISYVHVVPHPLLPCPSDATKGETLKCSSRDSPPLLFAAASPFGTSNKTQVPLGSGNPGVRDGDAAEGLGLCPSVRLLCVCLPPIEIEMAPSAEGAFSQGAGGGESKEELGRTAEETKPDGGCEPRAAATSEDCGSAQLRAPPVEMADNTPGCAAICTASCGTDGEETVPVAAPPGTPVLHPTVVTSLRRSLPSPTPRGWPVAVCSYSPKGSRFLAHAIVCCSLREGETLKSARGRLWYKEKRLKREHRYIAPGRASACVDDEGHGLAPSVGGSWPRHVTMRNEPRRNSSIMKAISFSLQHHPLAVFVGMVAVGTSAGRILCTPPPRCLVRRCYCEGECLAALKVGTSRGPYWDSPACDYVTSDDGINGVRRMSGQEAVSCKYSPKEAETGSDVPSLGISTSSHCPAVTAAKAGCGVAFFEVGDFGEGGGAVDYVELVRGTPWASRVQRKGQPQLLIPTRQRDFSWHWTQAPTAVAERRVHSDVFADGTAARNTFCGGLEAEALWLFACSKEAGLKIFRFMWSIQDGIVDGTAVGSRGGLQATCGTWRCVFTVRGSCQLVSFDINNGIIALCTPTDSRVYFLCFRHLLPAHIYLSNTTGPPVVSAEDMGSFARCGLPRPQHVPSCGYLAVQQQQYSSLLQSPAESARLELLVARRPSFLQPLGGRRWVVIDGAVIRVVQIKVKDAAVQRKPPDAARQELLQATLTGTPEEQLRQLRRPVVEEPELPWALGSQAVPELQTVRLCVFSHPRTIYQCAFDGVRRLVTVDLQEVLMVWDLQRYTKLCDLDLMANGSRHRGRSCSPEAQGCGEDGGDMYLISDGLCSDNESMRRNYPRRGSHGGLGSGVKSNSAKLSRKAAKLSLKKQFGTSWMQKRVLAQCSNAQHHQGRQVVHGRGPSADMSDILCNRTSSHSGEGIIVGGVWFACSSLEPALQLQSLYDMQKESGGSKHASSGPAAGAKQRVGYNHNGNGVETDATKSKGGSDQAEDSSSINATPAVPACEPARADDELSRGPYGDEKGENIQPLLSIAAAVCYADDFPPLGREAIYSQGAGQRKRNHSVPREPGTAPVQHPSSVTSHTAPVASATKDVQLSENYSKKVDVASYHGLSPPCAATWAGTGDSCINGKSMQPSSDLDATNNANTCDGGRPSFAAVVAAGGSSNSGCQRTGWASGPTDPSLLIGLLGEEGARALQEAASALGMSTEELYIQQITEWEQMQRRSRERNRMERNIPGQQEHELAGDTPVHSSGQDMTTTGACLEGLQQPALGLQDVRDGSQEKEQAKNTADEGILGSGAESSSRLPSTHGHSATPQVSPLQESGSPQRPSPRLPPLPMPAIHSLENRMVGLLGRQRYAARLGPNAQRRHVTAVCLSETSLALLFKNLKTWQIWTFSP